MLKKNLKKQNEQNIGKRKLDTEKIFVKIMAFILAALMVIGMSATVLYYIFAR